MAPHHPYGRFWIRSTTVQRYEQTGLKEIATTVVRLSLAPVKPLSTVMKIPLEKDDHLAPIPPNEKQVLGSP